MRGGEYWGFERRRRWSDEEEAWNWSCGGHGWCDGLAGWRSGHEITAAQDLCVAGMNLEEQRTLGPPDAGALFLLSDIP